MLIEKLKSLENEIKKLQKKDCNLIVADFDDTIFSRKEQLEKDENYRLLRGNKGNEYTQNILGIDNFIKLYYSGKKFPCIITKQLREKHDLILTAGFENIQKAKVKATGLDIINTIVVYNSEDKIYELIKYIIEELKFIPMKIVVYEDRPKHFIQHKELIETFLNTQLEIMFVEMTSNDENPKITKI